MSGALQKLLGKSALVGPAALEDPKWIPAYDPALIQAAFDKIYISQPSTKRLGFAMQKIYDVAFKETRAGFADTLVTVSAKPGELQEMTQGLVRAYSHWDPKHSKGTNPGYLAKLERRSKLDGRALGTILRRHADGTLPLVVTLLLKVLKDYDPGEFDLVGPPLRAADFKYVGVAVAANDTTAAPAPIAAPRLPSTPADCTVALKHQGALSGRAAPAEVFKALVDDCVASTSHQTTECMKGASTEVALISCVDLGSHQK